MANQVLAAQMIPRLGVTGLASPPLGRLPSHLDLLRLLHHHQHYNLVGFQGMEKICCKIEGKTHKARCQEGNDLMAPWDECRTGCIAAKNPCTDDPPTWGTWSCLTSSRETTFPSRPASPTSPPATLQSGWVSGDGKDLLQDRW